MLGLLRSEGPATATSLARRLDLNSGATSYHLRQLAQHGFVVEDTERGNARDRWWKAAHQATMTERVRPDDLEARETMDAYLQSVVTVLTEQHRQFKNRLSGSMRRKRSRPSALTPGTRWRNISPANPSSSSG